MPRTYCAVIAIWLGVVSTQVQAQDQPLYLQIQPNLLDPTQRVSQDQRSNSTADVPAFVSAQRIEGRTEDVVTLIGQAELRKAIDVIQADLLRYASVEDEVFALGSVRLMRNGDIYSGPELKIKLDVRTGYFLQPEFSRAQDGSRGKAERVDFLGPAQTLFTKGIYTTCAPGNLDWYMQAQSLQLNQDTQSGEARDAAIYFKGVPILASPWLSFPLDQGRKSGFLPPTFGLNSKTGAEFLLPYYWNIAPNRDFTFYPRLIGSRGFQTGAEFRYLEPTYRGEVRGEFLSNDRTTNSNRYAFVTTHQWANNRWAAKWNINKVSDDNYFVDFSRTVAVTSQRILPREGTVSYAGDYWNLTGRIQRYQTLQDPLNPLTPPYDTLPQLQLYSERHDVGGFDINFASQASRFVHPTQVQGNRLVMNPSVSFPLLAPGYFITPKLSYHLTRYQLDDTTPGTPTRLSRSVPILSLDSGLIFERDSQFFGQALRQTLEPRLFYVRTPFRDQSQFPNFDSGLTDFNFAQIFSENVFSGSDRIADANQLTTALVSRYLDRQTGSEKLRAMIGQRFYFTPQRVTLSDGTPSPDSRSHFLAALSAGLTTQLSLDSALEYNPQSRGVVRANLGTRWQPANGKVLNVAYRYLQDSIEQIDTSGQWPLGGNWHGVGRLNYSTRDKMVVESLGGLEYKACCWVMRLVGQRFATATATATTALFVQLELNGLSSLGSSPLEALKRNISGYQSINQNPSSRNPFENYQ